MIQYYYKIVIDCVFLFQNGFWLALGMCGVLMIPIIIFAVVTSHYYRRMKYEDDVGIPYESSFP